jgi:hypothetical protein
MRTAKMDLVLFHIHYYGMDGLCAVNEYLQRSPPRATGSRFALCVQSCKSLKGHAETSGVVTWN